MIYNVYENTNVANVYIMNSYWGAGVTFLFVVGAVYVLAKHREPFSLLRTDITGNPKEDVEPKPHEKPMMKVPDARTLAERFRITHTTEQSCMEQISNHRQSNEYHTVDNGTAKPFEMSAEFFHGGDPNKAIPRKHDFTMPPLDVPGVNRVGAFQSKTS